MIRCLRLVVSLAAAAPVALLAQAPTLPPALADAGAALTLEEAVARALDRNFQLVIQRFSTENAAQAIEVARAEFDPTFTVSGRTGVNQSATASSTLDGVTVEGPRSEFSDVRAGVSTLLPTGTSVSGSTVLARSETNSRNALLNPAYDGDVSLSVRQPLLRGFGVAYNRAAINRARLGLERANFDFRGAVLDVVRNVEIAYFNLVFARQQLDVRRFSLAVAEQLFEENRARRDTGVSTDLDVLQAEVGVANARRNVLLAEQTVNDQEDALLALIGQFEFAQGIGAVTVPVLPVTDLSFEQSYKLALDNQPDYASTAAAIEQLKIDADLARRNRLPNLDLGGAVGYNSTEPTARSAARNLWDGDGYAWQVDLALTVPWGFRGDRARYAQALSNLQREEAFLRQLDQNILVQVRAAVRAVETNQESVRISELATELSQRQFDLEKARFDAGLSTFRRVQEAQEDLDTARVAELQARVNLRNALADLARLEGTSLARYSITVE